MTRTTVSSFGPMPRQAVLSGWGRTSPAFCSVAAPRSVVEVERLIYRNNTIARGRGRSYGDAAQNSGGLVIDSQLMNQIQPIDPLTGEIVVGAGVTLDQLMRHAIPNGWFVPVTPGTRQVTIGGAIAADIHGKNHHHDGTFCRHVTSMTVSTGRGIEVLTPKGTPTEFWATAGGMGLTGIIVDATVRMRPIETAYMASRTERLDNLDSLMTELRCADRDSTYTVAWIDTLNGGKRLGRGLVLTGEHATNDQLDDNRRRRTALEFAPRSATLPPIALPLITPTVGKAFNQLWYGFNRPGERIETISGFFHPLDAIGNWNLLYGKRGFVQWQIVVPDSAEGFVGDALQQLSAIGAGSFLSVLKRFGTQNPGPLSFPTTGWTLAVDLPVTTPSLSRVLAELDSKTATHGGRTYLAKDARLDPDLIKIMYPDIDRWRHTRNLMDPDGIFRSDLSRRLRLTGQSAKENAA